MRQACKIVLPLAHPAYRIESRPKWDILCSEDCPPHMSLFSYKAMQPFLFVPAPLLSSGRLCRARRSPNTPCWRGANWKLKPLATRIIGPESRILVDSRDFSTALFRNFRSYVVISKSISLGCYTWLIFEVEA